MKFEKRKLKILGALFCCAVCSALFGLASVNSQPLPQASAQLVYSDQNGLKEVYFKNEVINIPQAQIAVDGNNYSATEYTLIYPDGRAYIGETHTLDIIGKYNLVYYATVEGKNLSANTEFTVVQEALEVGNGSSYEMIDDLTKKSGEDEGGLSVSLSEGTSFTYNQSIDITNSDLQTPIIELYPYHKNSVLEWVKDENGKDVRVIAEEAIAQTRAITVRITDCYDSNNYIDIQIDWSLNSPGDPILGTRREATCMAGASGQDKTALIANPNLSQNKWYANKEVDGEPYLLVMSGNYGKSCNYSESTGISFYYENATKRIYVQDEKKYLLADLDDPNLYFTAPLLHNNLEYVTGEPFKGFTTGEVYVSVFGTEYYGNTLQFEIGSIYGVKGQALGEKEVKDNVAPIIEVDVDADKTERIYVAKGEPFETFPAMANDLHGIGELKTTVWINYGTDRQALIGLRDGRFTPLLSGTYTIEYKAVDRFGNQTVKTIDVTAINAESGKAIDFALESDAELAAGENHSLSYTVSGLNGEIDVQAWATLPDGSTRKLSIENGAAEFFPESVGKYALTFVCSDGIMEKTFSYEITTCESENVSLTEPVLPEYLIKGMTYTFDYNEILYYDGVTASKKPIVYASEDGKEGVRIDYEEYTVGATEKVQFIYKDGDTEIGRSREIEVVDVDFGGSLSLDKYFVGDFTATKTASDIAFTSNVQTGNNRLAFINTISLNNFYFSFTIPLGGYLYEGLEITLIDYYNRDAFYTYSFSKSENNTRVSVYDQDGAVGSATVAKGIETGVFDLQYSSTVGMSIGGTGEKLGKISFSSDRVLMHIAMKGLTGNGVVTVRQINNQPFSDVSWDAYNASITTYSAIGVLEKGESITILPATVSDVLSPFVKSNFGFTVSNEKDEIMQSKDGVILNAQCDPTRSYEIELKEYGTYTLRYSYTDQAGEATYETILLNVVDNVAPTLTLQEGYGENMLVRAKAGRQLKLATYKVSDNETATEEISVKIVIVTPRNEVVLADSTNLALKLKGEYKVYYYCMDEQGNYTARYYTVIAE
ncbi:MAG: hypothetical protein IJ506_02930 [Clostridia bacterium]|nr:hypothetical protein [Clostridia bacterium]